MPQVSTEEFERLPLRVHTFLAGVPLHDVWSVDLPRWRAGVTLDDFLRTTGNCKLDTCGCSKSSSLTATSTDKLYRRRRGTFIHQARTCAFLERPTLRLL